MQGQDAFSVSRRPLDVEDYIDILRRHKAWIIGPLFFGLVASVVTAFLWPNTYVSTANIKVVPQAVPENLIQSVVNQQLGERVTSMAQTVLSRAQLTALIQSLELYPREKARLPMDDVVELMKKDIQIGNVTSYGASGPTKALSAFQIQYAYTDRMKASKVVSEIATKFINESVRERSSGSAGTYQLLKDQREAARKEMEDYDTKLASFRAKNIGHLPDEQSANLQQMNMLQSQLNTLQMALSRVSQEKIGLETQARILKESMSQMKEPAAVEIAQGKSDKVLEAEREVSTIEKQLALLREHYKDTYPGVQTTMSMLASARRKLEAAQKDDAARKPETRAGNPNFVREQRNLDADYKRVMSQLDVKDMEAKDINKQIAQANANLHGLQSRLEAAPFSEKENTELTRDRDLARAKFQDLDAKLTKTEMGNEMEKRRFGESLELLDPPSIPQTPSAPKRELIIGAGSAIGLLLGLLLAAAREMKDSSLKNLKDVRAYTQLPILGSVPLLENDLVVKRRKRLAWLGWSIAGLAGVVLMSSSVIYYYVTKV